MLLSGLCLSLGAGPVLGQTGTVAGRVLGSGTSRPVVGALVEVRSLGEAAYGRAVTDQEGTFHISGLVPGAYIVSVSAMGYGTQTADTVEVTSAGRATVSVGLEPMPIELSPLTVTGSRRTEKALESPAHVTIIGEREIGERPALTLADHLRSAPGVDIWTGGLQSTRVETRGFNSVFASSLHVLTDNRIAGVPSMRVNLLPLLPQTSDDIQRIEVVLGPGAALYGPNTGKGILHVITRSPIDDPGSAVSVTGGERGVLELSGRTALRV
ncbi:MAG TPA: TonB-dependent receptor plug domain-containing protein, partial [Longimicrobiales bacterium]|nr:TonB-dependent receptor plug domain-containing protein [Longimicrobiales bacterium]